MDEKCSICGGDMVPGQLITTENPRGGNYGLLWTFDTSNKFFHKQEDLHEVVTLTCTRCGNIQFFRTRRVERPSLKSLLFG
jgi:hypothetical protein